MINDREIMKTCQDDKMTKIKKQDDKYNQYRT